MTTRDATYPFIEVTKLFDKKEGELNSFKVSFYNVLQKLQKEEVFEDLYSFEVVYDHEKIRPLYFVIDGLPILVPK